MFVTGVSQTSNALTALIVGAAKGCTVSQRTEQLHAAVPRKSEIICSPFYLGSREDCDVCIKDPYVASVCMRLDFSGKRKKNSHGVNNLSWLCLQSPKCL
jgi:hypothetical protein